MNRKVYIDFALAHDLKKGKEQYGCRNYIVVEENPELWNPAVAEFDNLEDAELFCAAKNGKARR